VGLLHEADIPLSGLLKMSTTSTIKSLQDVGDAIVSAKIPAMCPRAEDDGIEVPLVDGISYEQLSQLSVALGTADLYVDVAPGVTGSELAPGRDHAVLTIRWP
jgi:hypothetical protein